MTASDGTDEKPRIGHDPFDDNVSQWVRDLDEPGDEAVLGDDPLAGASADAGERDPQALLAAALPDDLPAAVAPIERGQGMDGPRRPPPPTSSGEGEPSPSPKDPPAPAPPPLVSIGEVLRAEDRRTEASFSFPQDFRWGVSTSAISVEGFNLDSDWWAWEQEPGRVRRGHTSGVALDWWKNAESDFALAADMGFNSLRLAVDWARVEPGPGVFDEYVLERYAAILSSLRDRGIEPMVTLHHFSNPLWVAEDGGWESRRVAGLFSRYVRRAVEVLGEFCDLWCTMNDPNLYAHMAYAEGALPPGKSDPGAAVSVLRAMLEAHAAAYSEIHAVQPQARVGIAHNVRPVLPSDPNDPEDVRACERAHRAYNLSTVEALAAGRWTRPLGAGLAPRLRHKLDWIGVSYYGRDLVQSDGNRRSLLGRRMPGRGPESLDGGFGEFYPQGLFNALQRLSRLGIPLYITENGIPDDDDDQRPRYIVAHLYQVWRALQMSYPIAGYFHRTLVDSFEWADGWTHHFGLHSFDPGTSVRSPRRSAQLLSEIVRTGAIDSALIDQYAPQLRESVLPQPGPDA